MIRRITFLTLALLVVASAALGCEGVNCCCSKPFGAGAGSTPPRKDFAYGCYTGDGTNNRFIETGIPSASAGALFVDQVTTLASFCNRWVTPDMLTLSIKGRGQSNCTTNEDSALFGGFTSDGFTVSNNTVAPGDSLNQNAIAYCWYAWSRLANWHGTFTYVGDGSSPRTIAVGDVSGNAMAFIQNRNDGAGFAANNNAIVRTSEMAANQSMIWALATASASDTTGIRSFDGTGITVGSSLNKLNTRYFGAWWKWTSALLGGLHHYTGNGTSGGGNCGSGADTRNFTGLNCDPTGIFTMEDYFNEGACTHQECDSIRALNIQANLAGPGHSTTDWYQQQDQAPDDIALGFLTTQGYSARGGASNEVSCNDNTQTYWAGYWCGTPPPNGYTPVPTVTRTATPTITNTPTITQTPSATPTVTPTSADSAPPNWSSSFEAVWQMDEASSATRASTGSCTTNCALANNGSMSKNTTAGQFAFGTGGAKATTATTDFLSCASGTCSTLSLNAVSAATWGCYGYVGNDADTGTLLNWTTAATRWTMQRDTSNNLVQCKAKPASSGLVTAQSALNSWNASTLVFGACTFNDAANTLRAYANGVAGSTATTTDIGNTNTGNFQVGGGDFGFIGTSDMCFVKLSEMTDTDLCRICSCGIDPSLGSCLCTGGGASYTNSGRNAQCGNCTLPACNKAGPS